MFLYDNQITDRENGIRIVLTICDATDGFIQVRIRSGGLDIPFFLQLDKAGLLAGMIQHALQKVDDVLKSSETD